MTETIKTWIDTLKESSTLLGRSENARKKASTLLWDGAKAGIEGWDSDKDPHAEAFYADVLDALGAPRKGDASKIRKVALAVASEGLDVEEFSNLSQAYAAANALTKVKKSHDEEDAAADEAIQTIEAPKTASTAEAAAKIVLSKGVDEAARLLLDALGENILAHRALLRAVSQEINGRVEQVKAAEIEQRKAETEAKRAEREALAAERKAAREAAAAERAAKKVVAKKAAAKPKGAAKKAAATQKAVARPATPKTAVKKAVARPKGKPVARKTESAE